MDKNITERLRLRVSQHFLDSIAVKQEAEKILPAAVAQGVIAMTHCLQSGGKVMACGNGGSAADAQHFAAELIGRFERERQELAAIALTTDSSILTAVGNDYSYDEVFSKQVRGLGKPGDILLGISTSGNSKNVVKAIEAAKKLGMKIIALTGNGGGKIASLLDSSDVHLCAPSTRTARIQETHLVLLHSLCDGVDHLMLD
ncbi:phosphoheptose isomerase [Polynucleobacter paneuropaeus]|nr:phosphoheptose isomerase [Polynucleobacter paneuropaeus]MBT8532673.1 phosphoheptose isomerase [Polynucleobacter paneuropaeus]MBT8602887.1 phosphoheptose isomerase [Polynucleobacter paneuropaeus]MBT8624496.1 phosphoheptose isomerase [Polynucleobacter paneuropaeus]MBT8630394.1 phosphoheptose isomerase [Polynucleobacter paneuropaeus]